MRKKEVKFAKETYYNEIGEYELGDKLSTVVWVGKISIKFFENGVVMKPYSQARVFLSNDLVERLADELHDHVNRKKLADNL